MKPKGGKRPGAGRKSNAEKAKQLGFILKGFSVDAQEIKWNQLLSSNDENIVLKTMVYLSNRIYGMPKQALEHSGEGGGPIGVKIEFVNPQ
jgi:hypothetical protein